MPAYSFAKYEERSGLYTALRQPVGVERIVKLARNADIDVLDSGCGTGLVTVELMKQLPVRHVHCTDFCQEMLDQAKNNVEQAIRSSSHQRITDVSFSVDNVCKMTNVPSESFDLVMSNHMIHHLHPDNGFQELRNAAKEWYRVLKNGGKVSVIHEPAFNTLRSLWYMELLPGAMKKYARQAPATDTVIESLQQAGFKHLSSQPLYEEFTVKHHGFYFDYKNILANFDKYKQADSTFDLATDEEIEQAREQLQGIIESGNLESWWKKKEKERLETGLCVMVTATK